MLKLLIAGGSLLYLSPWQEEGRMQRRRRYRRRLFPLLQIGLVVARLIGWIDWQWGWVCSPLIILWVTALLGSDKDSTLSD